MDKEYIWAYVFIAIIFALIIFIIIKFLKWVLKHCRALRNKYKRYLSIREEVKATKRFITSKSNKDSNTKTPNLSEEEVKFFINNEFVIRTYIHHLNNDNEIPTYSDYDNIVNRFGFDKLFEDVARFVVIKQRCNDSLIRYHFNISYYRANRIIDTLIDCGIISLAQESEVLIKYKDSLDSIFKFIRSKNIDLTKYSSSHNFDRNIIKELVSFEAAKMEHFVEPEDNIYPNLESFVLTKIDNPKDFYIYNLVILSSYKSSISNFSIKERHFNDTYLPVYNKFIDNYIKIYLNEIYLKEEIREELLYEESKRNEKLNRKHLKEQLRAKMYQQGELTEQEYVRREPIPQDIQDRVWNRDGGKCVKCGSRERIEFDHIIPFSKGGTNTYRNLQILCEKCNRSKSNNIG